jgi:uncharacterized protein (DUF433 family)
VVDRKRPRRKVRPDPGLHRAYAKAQVTVDPRQAFGQALAVHGGARVEDLVDRFQAGDGFAEIAGDSGVPAEEEDVIGVALRFAA